MSQGALGRAGIPQGAPKGSGPPLGALGCVPEGRPRGFLAALGSQGASQEALGEACPGPQEGPRRSSQARVAGGGGAPLPHIKARGAAGAHKAGRAGGRAPGGGGGGGGEAETQEGRAAGRREGGRGPGGRRGLRWGGAAAPHLIVHGCRPAPPPGPASLAAAAAAAAAQRLPAALIVCQAPPPPLPAARPPASPAEPETTASTGRAPTPGPRRRLGPAAPTDSRLAQSTARKAASGAGLPAWRGPAGRLSEGRSPQPMGGQDRRSGRREGGKREARPLERTRGVHRTWRGPGAGRTRRACALWPEGGAAWCRESPQPGDVVSVSSSGEGAPGTLLFPGLVPLLCDGMSSETH